MGIIEGIKNTVIKNAEIEKIAADRLITCKMCPKYNNGVCRACGCLLSFKTRSLNEKCPKGLWTEL